MNCFRFCNGHYMQLNCTTSCNSLWLQNDDDDADDMILLLSSVCVLLYMVWMQPVNWTIIARVNKHNETTMSCRMFFLVFGGKPRKWKVQQNQMQLTATVGLWFVVHTNVLLHLHWHKWSSVFTRMQWAIQTLASHCAWIRVIWAEWSFWFVRIVLTCCGANFSIQTERNETFPVRSDIRPKITRKFSFHFDMGKRFVTLASSASPPFQCRALTIMPLLVELFCCGELMAA